MNQDILRFDVPMYNAVTMRVFQGTQNTDRYLSRQGGIQFATFLDNAFQRFPLHIFHHQIPVFPVHTDIQQIDDIMMRHFACGFRLTLESSDELTVLVIFRTQYFYRNIVSCTKIHRTVHNCHTTHADLFGKTVSVCKNLLFHCGFTSSEASPSGSFSPVSA